MALDREAIYSALFDRLKSNVPSVAFFTRRVIDYTNVRPDRMPSLELYAEDDTPSEARGRPPKWTLSALIVIYAKTKSDDDSPDTAINEVIRQVEAALESKAGETGSDPWATTLGGLVSHCWIAGKVRRVQGAIGGQAWAEIPLEMIAVTGTKG